VSLRTRASKHPIEQPPQPLDRSSLNLQNPERSSSLEAPRAFTRHWSSRRSCTRATTRRRHIRTPEHGLLGSETTKWHHHWSPLRPIYHLAVEQTLSECTRASTRRRKCRRQRSRAPAPPHLSKPRTGASQLRFKKLAPRPDSLEDDLSFGGGKSSIGGRTRLHAPSRLRRNSLRASTRGHAAACVRHTRPRSWHTPEPRVASLCSCVIPYRQSARHVSMPRGKKKKKKRGKNWEDGTGLSTVQIHPQGLYGLASKLSFLNLLFMQFP
jgi:hypothetical protein